MKKFGGIGFVSLFCFLAIVIFDLTSASAQETSPSSLYRQAADLYGQGNYSKAMDLLNQIKSRDTEGFEVNFLKGAVSYKSGQWEQACRYMEKAIVVNKNSLQAFRILAMASLRLKQPDFRRALEGFTKARSLLQENAQVSLIHELDYYTGFTLFSLKEYKQAIPFLKRVHQSKPTDHRILYWLLWSSMEAQGCSESRDYMEKYLRLQPTRQDVLVQYGFCLLKTNRADLAYEVSEKIRKHYPRLRDGFLIGGQACLILKGSRLKQAEKLLMKAINLDNKYPEAYYYLALYYDLRGSYETALKTYGKALALKDSECEWWFKKGRIYEHLLKKADAPENYSRKALECYQKTIRLCPRHGEAKKRRNYIRQLINQNSEQG